MAKSTHKEVKKPETDMFSDFFTPEMAEKSINKTLQQDEKDAVERLYLRVFHVGMAKSCNNCISDAFFELYNLYKRDYQHFVDLFECEYRLKGGVLLEIFSQSKKFATNKNLTNALAEEHLKADPRKARLFSQLPPDWELRIK